MGMVTIETYNAQLMGVADYEDAGQLKSLLRNYDNLHSLAQSGDSVAACIFIDLKTAMQSPLLTKTQRNCITWHLIEKNTLEELSKELGIGRASIAESVRRGVTNLQKALRRGDLYE